MKKDQRNLRRSRVQAAIPAALLVASLGAAVRADINVTTTFTVNQGVTTPNIGILNLNSGVATINGTLTTNQVNLNGGTLDGYGTIAGPVVAGSGAHAITPSLGLAATSTGTLTMNSLTTSSLTTLTFNLVTPNTANGSDMLDVTNTNGLTLGSGGTITVANHATGAASLGYYKIMQYSGTIGGAGISGLTLPATANGVKYVLDTTHDPGFVDLHRGYLGDANDNGFVDLTDLTILASNWQHSGNWSQGDFDGSGFVDLTDLTILAQNWQTGIGGFGAAAETVDPSNLSFQEAVASIVFGAEVPEPASVGLLGVGAVGLLARRRRGAR